MSSGSEKIKYTNNWTCLGLKKNVLKEYQTLKRQVDSSVSDGNFLIILIENFKNHLEREKVEHAEARLE